MCSYAFNLFCVSNIQMAKCRKPVIVLQTLDFVFFLCSVLFFFFSPSDIISHQTILRLAVRPHYGPVPPIKNKNPFNSS